MRIRKIFETNRMDRLSNLPDSIRNQILSLLPTKDALRTSLLSSQWRYTSSSLPKLEFRQTPKICNSNFRNCVHKTLTSHDETDLESLSLKFFVDEKYYVTTDDLTCWVNIALKNKIQRFYLNLYCYRGEPRNLPSDFFQCDTLQVLSFENFALRIPFRSRVRFSNLRTLVLENIRFDDQPDHIDLVNKIFHQTTLPVLEVLEINHCAQFHTLRISIPSLVKLKLFSYYQHERVFVSIPSLRDIFYDGCPLEVCPKTLASLKRGTFSTDVSYVPNTDASDILFGLCNVETLSLKSQFIESLSVDQLFFGKSPILSATLKHLHLEIYPTKKQFQVISFLLKCFPKLQAIYIYCTFITPEDELDEDEFVLAYFEGVSKLPILEIIEVNYFGGTEVERDLVLYLLQRASDLTKVNINYNPDLKESQITDIEKLLTLPRGSV